MRSIPVILFLLLTTVGLHAQDSTSTPRVLRSVKVKSSRVGLQYRSSVQTIDTATLKQYHQQSLRDLLQTNSNAVIKNYGVSGMSTLSLRGSSAAQTSILWNGLNLNNAATGLTDLSLLPVGLFDEVKIDYQGDRSIGGGLYLNNLGNGQEKGASLRCGIGYESLDNISFVATQKTIAKNMMMENKVYVMQANNRYKYYNDNLKTYIHQTHARQFSTGYMNNLRWNLSPYKALEFHNWYQRTYRELPVTLYELRSEKKESMSSWRSNFRYSSTGKKGATSLFQLGFIYDQYSYSDSLILLHSELKSFQLPVSMEHQWIIRKNLRVGIQGMGHYAQLLEDGSARLVRGGFRLQGDYQLSGRVEWKNFIQKEWSTPFNLPLIYGTSFMVKIHQGLYLFMSANKQYRSPTLNELYYKPGGNIHLLPERSDNMEGGFRFQRKHDNFKIESNVCTYLKSVHHWIVWYGNSIFTPHNVLKVLSRGVEWDAQMEKIWKGSNAREDLQHKDLLMNIGFFYSYNLATTVESQIQNDYSVDKQLPYIPRYQYKYRVKLSTATFSIQYDRSYTGYRFTTTDESEYLLPYSIHNITMMKKIRRKKKSVEVYLHGDNMLNTSYQGIRGRMMPGRNGRIHVLISL